MTKYSRQHLKYWKSPNKKHNKPSKKTVLHKKRSSFFVYCLKLKNTKKY